MRFMVMLKMQDGIGPAPAALNDAMTAEMGRLMGSGVMVDAGGLRGGAEATRVRLTNGTVTVTDGPFTEAKELVGGYAMLQVATPEEAVKLGTELIQLHKDYWPGWEGEAEIRQLDEPEVPEGPGATG